MIRGLYTATSGMTLNERMQEVISNNIANANTVGYKGDTGIIRSFPEELIARMNDNKGGVGAENRGPIGLLSQGAVLEEVMPRFVPGALTASDNPHARAIIDQPQDPNNPYRRSYFPVQVGGQTMYTRDGDFQVQSGTNFLVTTAGDPVLPINQVNGLPMENARIQVQPDGQYRFTNQNGAALVPTPFINPMQGAVDITDSSKLNKYGDTYFTGGTAERGTGQIQNGQLEQSNVDLAGAMVSMMNVARSYEANQRMIRTLDSTLEKAVSIGRLG